MAMRTVRGSARQVAGLAVARGGEGDISARVGEQQDAVLASTAAEGAAEDSVKWVLALEDEKRRVAWLSTVDGGFREEILQVLARQA